MEEGRLSTTIIFDLDGVITDTVPYHFRSWQQLFRDEGRAFTQEEYRDRVDGLPREVGITNVLGKLPITRMERLMDKKKELYLRMLRERPPSTFPGFEGFLERLTEQGVTPAVASSSKNTALVLELLAIDDLFPVVITGHDFRRPKPAPDIFLAAAGRLGVPPEECVVIEDVPKGVEAAKAGGMRAVGYASGHEPDHLREAGADFVFSNYKNASLADILG